MVSLHVADLAQLNRGSFMAQRTYLYGLWLAMTALSRYISRWLVPLEANMNTQQFLCLQAVVTAINECLPLIQPAPPVE